MSKKRQGLSTKAERESQEVVEEIKYVGRLQDYKSEDLDGSRPVNSNSEIEHLHSLSKIEILPNCRSIGLIYSVLA